VSHLSKDNTNMQTKDAFEGLEPKGLWAHFAAMTGIPRPSGHEAEMAQYIADWAQSHSYSFGRDSVGNICVYVPATPNAPGLRPVALQAHLDMVCVRDGDAVSDPATGNIQTAREGEWIKALGSTLGADDGIGIAAALYLAQDREAAHGPLELLFTIEEETTFRGADGLDPDVIHADVMLNLDAVSSAAVEVGCAGAAWSVIRWSAPRRPIPEKWVTGQIVLSGLRGGHSGIDIHLNRLNAIKGMLRLLRQVAADLPVQVCAIEGGDATNAIPIRAISTIAYPGSEAGRLVQAVSAARLDLAQQYGENEPALQVTQVALDTSSPACWSPSDSDQLLDLLDVIPSGVLAMDPNSPGLVETSNNLGMVAEESAVVTVHCLSRSSSASAQAEVVESIESAAHLAGAEFAVIPPVVPPWRVDPGSRALATVLAAYHDLFDCEPATITGHGAAESGTISQHFPRLDIVSLGPDIEGAHMPGERVNIPSVLRFYRLLSEVVRRLAF
jgi:dipeptidase D